VPGSNKLLDGICNNPKDVRSSDACNAAAAIGFVEKGGKGSHWTFARPGETTMLNLQNRKGRIPPYQARQLIVMIERYRK
jgi:hypothetical protein